MLKMYTKNKKEKTVDEQTQNPAVPQDDNQVPATPPAPNDAPAPEAPSEGGDQGVEQPAPGGDESAPADGDQGTAA